eukprot:3017578-Amphidinium_carterae.1
MDAQCNSMNAEEPLSIKPCHGPASSVELFATPPTSSLTPRGAKRWDIAKHFAVRPTGAIHRSSAWAFVWSITPKHHVAVWN